MADSNPLVSIGMPVYNGEQHIRQALDSLLAQVYGNFELIISDNASTDETPQICQEYTGRDERVRCYRHERNMGAAWNFNRVFELSSGEYFMWAADDDWWNSAFISKCIRRLANNPRAILCYPLFRRVSVNDGSVEVIDPNIATKGLNRFRRLHVTILRHRTVRAIYGLFRRDALARTTLFAPYIGSDRVLLIRLSILGDFINVPEVLLSYRHQRYDWTESLAETIGLANFNGGPYYPKTSACASLIRGILQMRIPVWQKPVLVSEALYCWNRRYGHMMRGEWQQYLVYWRDRYNIPSLPFL